MSLASLAYRTDLIFARFNGDVTEKDDYLVVRTPSNPTYWWGNFLLFRRPPEPGDEERWTALFHREIGAPPEVEHIALGYDSGIKGAGNVKGFLAAGFTHDESVVLSAQQKDIVKPAKFNTEAELRPLASEAEWQEVVELQVASRENYFSDDEAGYRRFRQDTVANYRKMVAAGLGYWFGAFLNGALVADLGIFCENGVARFQNVETHPAFRRRGLCGALVYTAAQRAFATLGAQTLVMVADPEYHAANIYESVGFQPTEYQGGLEYRPNTE